MLSFYGVVKSYDVAFVVTFDDVMVLCFLLYDVAMVCLLLFCDVTMVCLLSAASGFADLPRIFLYIRVFSEE